MKKVIEASEAVALGAKMCKPTVIPAYPITPQTHIVEDLADYVFDGDLDAEMIHVESEHSAMSACIGVSAMGERTFTATASQGLALMHEMLFIASGMRLPIVMAVANRALSAPINIWGDQSDSIASRDSGWIQLFVESAQEAIDTTIMAFKIAEDHKIMLPVMICLDGFTLSHVFEPVDIPEQKQVDSFVPKFKPIYSLDPKKPMTFGPVGYPDTYMLFKKQQHDAMIASLDVIKKVNSDFSKKFKRCYGNGLIETYNMGNAKTAIIAAGTVCGTARTLIDELKKRKIEVGLIKLKSFRPFPHDELIKAASKLKSLVVIDRNMSYGADAAFFTEAKAALKDSKITVNSFIMGLGGRDITKQDINAIIDISRKGKKGIKQWVL